MTHFGVAELLKCSLALIWMSLIFKRKVILHDLLSYFFVLVIPGDPRIQWLHQMSLFLLPYYFKQRLEAFRTLLPRGNYEMSKWSHQPLGLAWEWRLNLVMGIEEDFLEVLSPSWSFSSENIPLSCVIVQNGTLTTELNLSGISFRTLSIPSGRKPTEVAETLKRGYEFMSSKRSRVGFRWSLIQEFR